MGKNNSRFEASEKADRKFEKKLQFYSKVRESVASLGATKGVVKKNKNARRRQKKLKVYDLSILTDFLPELKDSQQEVPPVKFEVNCKTRQKQILKEAKRVRTVLSHPVFRSDPLAAIHQHLQSTQPPPETKPAKKSNDDGKRKKRKKLKSLSRPQSMEM